MHVLILALRRGIINMKFSSFFLAKWLSHSFNRKILRKKDQGKRTSYPLIFWLFKNVTRAFNFLRTFLFLKVYVTHELTYVTKFYIRMFLLCIWGNSPPCQYLALYTEAKILSQFLKNDPLNHKGRRINIWN